VYLVDVVAEDWTTRADAALPVCVAQRSAVFDGVSVARVTRLEAVSNGRAPA
jgi:hypothetical protein